MNYIGLICLSVTSGTCVGAPGAERASLGAHLPEYLVLAEVLATEETRPGLLTSTLRIGYVYTRQKSVVGEVFRVVSTKSGVGGSADLHPPLAKAEQGIWALRKTQDGFVYDWSSRLLGVRLPARKGLPGRYEAIRKLAEAVEAIDQSGAEGRTNLIKDYARSRTPEVSAWAIRLAGALGGEGLLEFLRGLVAEQNVTVSGQAALDEVLCRRDETWVGSEVRGQLLREWVSSDEIGAEAAVAKDRLDVAAQRGELDEHTLLGLMKVATLNRNIPLGVRRDCCRILGTIVKKSKSGKTADRSYEYLLELVTAAKDQQIRVGAAYAIRNFAPLNESRTALLKKAAAASQDEKVGAILDEAIRQKKRR